MSTALYATTANAESTTENQQAATTEAQIAYSPGETAQGVKSPLLCQLS
jgi:hypothetical protein